MYEVAIRKQIEWTEEKFTGYVDLGNNLQSDTLTAAKQNCLANYGKLADQEGDEIQWKYFELLVNLQNVEGFHAAIKLRKRHIEWEREKMKVKVATQTFSNSVGNALLFLSLDLKRKDFKNAEYVDVEAPMLKYILTYKMSEDHLEILFSVVRSRGGSNDNTTARQFKNSYKRLLLHIEIKGADSGNAIAVDNTAILHCASQTITDNEAEEDLQTSVKYLRITKEVEDHDYTGAPVWHLTTYINDVVIYIAEFVVNCFKKCISCAYCS
ncbi:hypothetical protein ILUMI_04340 [Ignelater luminosus]|uniref:Uncharacterized protein n=1 Tax=Ignelater luminosus TaxID=2038154 RepID=A0A8K0DE25_IGNLU|nr:hypothetical protein ILUMI_04340 [Ignelater luminosus]